MKKKNFSLSNKSLSKTEIITIGGATRDIMFYTDKGRIIDTSENPTCQKLLGFELSAKIDIQQPYYTIGGGACNAAVNFSKLGFKASAVIRVGDDKEGKEIIKNFKKYKINASFAQVDKKIATGFSFLVIGEKNKEYVAFLYRGANDNLQLTTHNLQLINNSQQFKTKCVYVSSLSGENWENILNNVVKIKKFNSNIKFVWNPGISQLKAGYSKLKDFLKAADLLVLNQDEAIELVYSSGEKIKDIERLLKIIKSWGVKIAVITKGAEGASAYDGEKIEHQPAYPTKVVDTTGAGDAFGSTLAAGLILYNDLGKALKLAAVNSASVLTEIGAHNGLLDLKELNKKYLTLLSS
ncbi:MAG: ribokinase family sugar kinase [Parcubacteria group bacterium Athens1014_10]|nr:MAG: ribokinase family sugar kinase [Parcubacteria group bacterium Athens1014_10]TSD04746.1 MAG: ribokinase family sugar kinase [Parcubacteria group bacterium Athens0714_12]